MTPGQTDFYTRSHGMKCSFKLGNDHKAFKRSYFNFEKWWLNVEGFKSKVHEWWSSFEVLGRPDYKLATVEVS